MVTLLFSLAVVFFIGGIVFILRATGSPLEEQLALSAEKENWENIKISLEQKQEQLSSKKSELENKIKEIEIQLSQGQLQIQALTNENRELQEKTEGQETHSRSLQEEIHKLRDERKVAEVQWQEKAETLRQELSHVREENEQKSQENTAFVQGLQEEISFLKSEKEKAIQKQGEASEQKLAEAISHVEQLEKEKNELSNVKTSLEENFKKASEFNKILMEQEKILREELIKSRAQTLGLEKICAEFKIQIEAAAARTG